MWTDGLCFFLLPLQGRPTRQVALPCRLSDYLIDEKPVTAARKAVSSSVLVAVRESGARSRLRRSPKVSSLGKALFAALDLLEFADEVIKQAESEQAESGEEEPRPKRARTTAN